MGIPASYRFGAHHPLKAGHLRMLKAIVCGGEEGKRAFSEWEVEVEFDEIDYLAQLLAPALYVAAGEAGYDGPLRPRLKSLYTFFFTKTSLLLSAVAPVLEDLRRQGVDAVLLKGAGVSAALRMPPGRRPMHDLDLLVAETEGSRALDILSACGFHSVRATEAQRLYWSPHGHDCENGRGHRIDLHIAALYEHVGPGFDDGLRARTVTGSFLGAAARIPCPEDQLLLACVNGVRAPLVFEETYPDNLLWILDAAGLIRGAAIDWGLFVATAEARGVSYNVRYALRYLQSVDAGLVPTGVMERLRDNLDYGSFYVERALRVHTRYHRRRQAIERRNARSGNRDFSLRRIWDRHRIKRLDESFISCLLSFPGYLKLVWGLGHFWQLPGHALRRLMKKMEERKCTRSTNRASSTR